MTQVPDKERDLVNEMLRVVDSKGYTMGEIMCAVLNVMGFVVLTGVDKEYREEVLAFAVCDIHKVISFLAEQLAISFDWGKFEEFKEIYEKNASPNSV